ncbi:MAG: BolA family transcriptional regulator [Candidatus Dadabacteria bacterium]|nr:BolA family transcriptional regulator [Candidatus Dadabacteria bacterium]NIS07728.1 BolA family transcriptional regulator [Candidatus Dadabacteria bacterium]NIV42333.1 BolA/IbaG family iron-sulfur metabolism protein [Candidatus Dadabacteria bacterium]NIY21369.1 BolA/IbaG family iron-sulfur metabolism protein [Candidatus Dadabacteria bacterium]
MDPEKVKELIESGMSAEHVTVTGDGAHFEAVIVSYEFQGKNLVQRHQVVYGALGDAMREDIHALSMKTYTPEQWKEINN